MKLGWIEISFTWHGPGSKAMIKRRIDKAVRYAYAFPETESMHNNSRLVAAIKCHRRLTGSALVDAKRYCEEVCNHIRSN